MSDSVRFTNLVHGMGLSDVSSLHEKFSVNSAYRKLSVKVLGSDIYIYPKVVDKAKKRKLSEAQLAVLKGGKFKGDVTPRIRRLILELLNRWQLTIEHHNRNYPAHSSRHQRQIVLLTLTLSKPQHHSDKWIKRNMLSKLLQELQQSFDDFNYIWKAERQKNQNIHFHLLIDRYIDKAVIQTWWNVIQSKHGYHDMADFEQKEEGLPSTKIEGLRNKRNAIAYVAKYISKNEDDVPIEGRIWGCSDNLRALKSVDLELTHKEADELIATVRTDSSKVAIYDYCIHITKCRILDVLTYAHQTPFMLCGVLDYNYSILYDQKRRTHDICYKQKDYSSYLNDAFDKWYSIMKPFIEVDDICNA